MAFKTFQLSDGLEVTIYKRAAARSLRLSLAANGAVKLTIPTWTPYRAGLAFVETKRDWIASQAEPVIILKSGQAVGKAHHLLFKVSSDASRPTSRVRAGVITVVYPALLTPQANAVQRVAQKACIKALRNQAEALLPQRTAQLAAQHQFRYASVSVKQLTRRWGSCDTHKNIIFNLYLMQLPWDCIDYVIYHELTHTQVLHHGADFWQKMEQVLPAVNYRRKQMRLYQPVLQ
jgi:predicted metal-dependent hydrolase